MPPGGSERLGFWGDILFWLFFFESGTVVLPTVVLPTVVLPTVVLPTVVLPTVVIRTVVIRTVVIRTVVSSSISVFFKLFEVAEPKMSSKTSRNPNCPQKTSRNPNCSQKLKNFSKLTIIT